MHTFQREGKIDGTEFEELALLDLVARGFQDIQRNVHVKGTGAEVDFLADNKEFVECKGGKGGDIKKPGAQRTDNVKKAIANASLIKARYPDTYYVVYFSAKPKPGSYSEEMLTTALEFGILDEVRYIEY